MWQEQETEISGLLPGFVLVFGGDFQKCLWKHLCDLDDCILLSKVTQAFRRLEPTERQQYLYPYMREDLLLLLSQ